MSGRLRSGTSRTVPCSPVKVYGGGAVISVFHLPSRSRCISAHPVHEGLVFDEVGDNHVVHVQNVVDSGFHLPHEGSHEDWHVFKRLGARDQTRHILHADQHQTSETACRLEEDKGSRVGYKQHCIPRRLVPFWKDKRGLNLIGVLIQKPPRHDTARPRHVLAHTNATRALEGQSFPHLVQKSNGHTIYTMATRLYYHCGSRETPSLNVAGFVARLHPP